MMLASAVCVILYEQDAGSNQIIQPNNPSQYEKQCLGLFKKALQFLVMI